VGLAALMLLVPILLVPLALFAGGAPSGSGPQPADPQVVGWLMGSVALLAVMLISGLVLQSYREGTVSRLGLAQFGVVVLVTLGVGLIHADAALSAGLLAGAGFSLLIGTWLAVQQR
jgi:hypothetical protein